MWVLGSWFVGGWWVVFAIVFRVGSVVELDFGVWLRVLPGFGVLAFGCLLCLGVCWWVSGFGFVEFASALGS